MPRDFLAEARQQLELPDSGLDLEQNAKLLLRAYFLEMVKKSGAPKPGDTSTGKAILDATPQTQAEILAELCRGYLTNWEVSHLRGILQEKNLPMTPSQLLALSHTVYWGFDYGFAYRFRIIERAVKAGDELSPELRDRLSSIRDKAEQIGNKPAQGIAKRINNLLGETRDSILPGPSGETWSADAIRHVENAPEIEKSAWKKLFAHTQIGDASKPSAVWIKSARTHLAVIGDSFVPCVVRWLSAVAVPPKINWTTSDAIISDDLVMTEYTIRYRNINILKGLAWACAGRTEPEIARALERMTLGCLAKVPGTGPWAVRAASAAVYALSESPDNPEAVPTLARLKSKVTFRTTLTLIEKALEVAANRQGVTKDDLEDLCVPTYGLDSGGVRRELFGTAEMKKGIDEN